MAKAYTPKHFIKKFSAIPEDRWTTKMYRNNITGQCCALGHCLYTKAGKRRNKDEADALANLFPPHLSVSVIDINDNAGLPVSMELPVSVKFGKTPKTRVLGALRYIAKKIEEEKKKYGKQAATYR